MASRAFYLLLVVSLLLSIRLARGGRLSREGSATKLNELMSEQIQARPAQTSAFGLSNERIDKEDTSVGASANYEKLVAKKASDETGSSSTGESILVESVAEEKKPHDGRSAAAFKALLEVDTRIDAGNIITPLSELSTKKFSIEEMRMEFFANVFPLLLNRTYTALFLVRLPSETSQRKLAEIFVDRIKRELSQACIIELQDEASLETILKDYKLKSLSK